MGLGIPDCSRMRSAERQILPHAQSHSPCTKLFLPTQRMAIFVELVDGGREALQLYSSTPQSSSKNELSQLRAVEWLASPAPLDRQETRSLNRVVPLGHGDFARRRSRRARSFVPRRHRRWHLGDSLLPCLGRKATSAYERPRCSLGRIDDTVFSESCAMPSMHGE